MNRAYPALVVTTMRALRRGIYLYGKNRSLRAVLQGMRHILLKLGGQSPPQVAFLSPTYRCQCDCDHCYADARRRSALGEMTTETAKAVIDQVRGIGAIHLNITGGEPLLRDDLSQLVAHAHSLGLLTRISTNGYLLTRDRVADLRRAGLNQCGIAIDDADPATHDRHRRLPGIFERAVQGFHYLHEYGIESRLMTFARHHDLPQGMESILHLARGLGVKAVHINFPYASGRWGKSFEEIFSEDEMEQLRTLRKRWRSPMVIFEFLTRDELCCAADHGMLYINASGEVTPCPAIPYGIGNLHKEALAAIWKRHTKLMRLDYRGRCPVNDLEGRDALRKHAELVQTSKYPGREPQTLDGLEANPVVPEAPPTSAPGKAASHQ